VTGNSGGSNRVCCHLPLAGDRHLAAAIAGKSSGGEGSHKRSRQDWFRLYLLPAALSGATGDRAGTERQGVVALLDSRVLHRSYGSQVLAALGPLARINYLTLAYFPNLVTRILNR